MENPQSQLGVKAIRLLVIFVLVTAVASLLYGIQYLLGSPFRLAVTSQIYDLAVSPDGTQVAVAAEDGAVRLWDLTHGESWPLRTLPAHDRAAVFLSFDRSGEVLLTADRAGTVRLWHAPSGALRKEWSVEGGVLEGASMDRNGSTLATVNEAGIVRIWDVATGQGIRTISSTGNRGAAVAISPDGSLVATGAGHDVQIWDAHTGAEGQRLQGHWEAPGTTEEEWIGHEKDVTVLAFNADGSFLASGSIEGAVLIWNLEDGTVEEAKGHLGSVLDLEFDDTGRFLLSGGSDNMLRRWTVPDGKFGGVFVGHLGAVSSVGFAPDGNALSGGVDGSLRLWDVERVRQDYLAWTQDGLMPLWGLTLAVWLLGSGLLGLLLAWGLQRMRTWGYLGAMVLYLIGPLFTTVFPLLEVTAYEITWLTRLKIAWPLLTLLAWYIFLVLYLRQDVVAIPYQAPDATSLAEQLMASRRSQKIRRAFFEVSTWLFIFVLLFALLRQFGLDVAFMRKWIPFIMDGAKVTLYVSAAAIVLATILALFGALARLSNNPVANGISGFYISLIRGTPLLVQVFIWYLALPQVGLTLDPRLAGILALGVNYGAYMTETFRAGIQAISKGQHEAAHALGMTAGQTFRRIVLPQAFRIVIPPIGNDFIAMMKDSSLVSIITVQELTFRAQKIGRQNFRNLETFLIAAAFYWILTIIFQFFQGKLEEYMARGERR